MVGGVRPVTPAPVIPKAPPYLAASLDKVGEVAFARPRLRKSTQ